MPKPTTRPPTELMAALVRALLLALEAQTQSFFLRLARPLMGLISRRVVAIGLRFRRYVERIEAGRPFPSRRTAKAPPSPDAPPRQPTPDKLPRHVGWLGNVLPNIVPFRGQLSGLLQAPEVVAAIEAAPEQMGRVLRPLCRMLGMPPPPSIARPPRRRPVRQPKPPPQPPMPAWPHDPRKRNKLGFYIGAPPTASVADRLGPRRAKKPA